MLQNAGKYIAELQRQLYLSERQLAVVKLAA